MQLYFALLIVLLICLVYDHRLFLVVLLGSILLVPMSRYLGGAAYRCDIEGDCINREYGDYTKYPNDYLTEKDCKADCPKRFIPPVPEEFIKRIKEGGNLFRPYRQFSKDFERIEKYMDMLASTVIKTPNGYITKLRDHISNELLQRNFPNNFRGMLITLYGHITNDKVWWDDLDLYTDELSQNQGRFIHLPITWDYTLNNQSGGHTVTAIVDTQTKTIHIIDSNIGHTVDAEKEKELYLQLISGEFKNYKLNMSMNYWEDQTCPLALQRAIETGSCQTWVVYTSILYMLNIDIPKKELIEISNKYHEKSPEILTQLLFYIYQTLPEIRNILNSWNEIPDKSYIKVSYFINKKIEELEKTKKAFIGVDWIKLIVMILETNNNEQKLIEWGNQIVTALGQYSREFDTNQTEAHKAYFRFLRKLILDLKYSGESHEILSNVVGYMNRFEDVWKNN